jgi:hypothetical protein
MARNVVAQVLGGGKRVLDNCNTVADVKRVLEVSGYTASVNGMPENDQYVLQEGDFVSLSQAVKGGLL